MRHSKILLIFISLVLNVVLSITAFAGTTGKISGKIIDKSTGEVLIGANVFIVGTTLGAASDVNGNFTILNIPPGKYAVKARYIGYTEVLIKDINIEADRTVKLQFTLQPESYTTDEVVVMSYKSKMLQPDRTSTKQVYRAEDVKNIPGINNVSNIIGLQADVADNHFRGGRANQTNYLINGVSIVNPISNGTSFNPMVSALQQVDVITSGFSAEYGNAQSGVVNMIMKDGGDKWASTFTVESDLPHYKHWGESVYSSDVRQYDKLLRDTETWWKALGEFGIDETERLYQRGGASEFLPSQFAFSGRKSAKALAFLAQQEYLLSHNEVGRDYFNEMDRRYDITIGGPITQKVRLFLAGQIKSTNNRVPYYVPNDQYQIMGNLSYHLDDNNFKFQYMKSTESKFGDYRTFYSYDLKNYESYMEQMSLKWQHLISPTTFFNTSFGYMNSGTDTRSPLTAKGEGQGDYFYGLYSLVSGQGYPYVDAEYGGKGSKSFSFMSDYTSQIDFYNLVKAGVFFNYNQVFSDLVTSDDGSKYSGIGKLQPKDQVFDYNPYDGAIYVQDKIEYEGIVLNAGLRYDFYNFNMDAYSDIVSPTRNPNFISLSETPDESYYDESKAKTKRTSFVGKLAPRLGLSFPIAETAVFHANYGVFIQRPNLTSVFQRNRIVSGKLVDFSFIGNPHLKPEETSSYDIGVVFKLPLDFEFDVSAYYKGVENLLAPGRYVDEQQKDYDTQVNRDYANIEGFHVNIEKRSKHLNFFVRYNWEQATGKSEGYADDRTIFIESVKYGPLHTSSAVTPEDEFMDYDRTHKLVASLTLKTNDYGASIFNDIIFSTTYHFMSGRPFTYDPSGQNLIKNKRTIPNHDLSMRITKLFNISTVQFSFYMDVFNMLDFKQFEFWYLNGSTYNTRKYFTHAKNYSLNDLNRGDFWSSNSLDSYSGQPLYIRFGLSVNL